jgi:hypothetical protein
MSIPGVGAGIGSGGVAKAASRVAAILSPFAAAGVWWAAHADAADHPVSPVGVGGKSGTGTSATRLYKVPGVLSRPALFVSWARAEPIVVGCAIVASATSGATSADATHPDDPSSQSDVAVVFRCMPLRRLESAMRGAEFVTADGFEAAAGQAALMDAAAAVEHALVAAGQGEE